ncbi:MAG: DUF2793 domain-containing protein [Pseudomonadota bacterium]
MDKTGTLELPLVQPAQAQKHVTVNEALARVDALVQMTLASRSVVVPPIAPDEGAVFAVPGGAVNAWEGQDGALALFLNGGWVFLTPQVGWRGWIADEGVPCVFDGVAWQAGQGAVSENGAAMLSRVVEIDHTVGSGVSSETNAVIPAGSLVFGVTGRVVSALGGAAATWRLGIGGVSDDRYGSGLGKTAGSWVSGLTSSPLAYYADTALTLTGEDGALDDGVVRLAVHLAELQVPRG